ncbi:MAG: deoxynucleoside monophosphate kinase [Hyperionvirus sp.]|uniref:Deoxynucleoside monophosphate kinase n=1 Tax=Hyperionvirus sp. TaxID=2487770 RepID=A0A3G5A8G1_9VIRU|nr:MAG: deoxynucleoside monophosphate kinase [Hyperionvirus sp.]
MNLPNIIGVTGLKFNGKDTIADYLCERYGYTRVAFADPLKEICGTLFGFSREQLYGDLKEVADPEWFDVTPRKILQFVGTELFRENMSKLHLSFRDEFWLLCAKKKINDLLSKDPNVRVVVSDVRFPNECAMIAKLGGVVVRVTRPSINITTDLHSSEKCIPTLEVSSELFNTGTVPDLHKLVDKYIKQLSIAHGG